MAGKPEQEPSIEEILASIRQIISDDDEPKVTSDVDVSAKAEPARESDLTLKGEADTSSSFADVLDLTAPIEEPRESGLDLSNAPEEKFTIPVATPEPKQESKFASIDIDLSEHVEAPRVSNLDLSESNDDSDSIFTTMAATATTQAFSRLMSNIPVERDENKTLYADGRITLEDIVKDMLRPMLREWINDNVPTIVERLVAKELEKLSRNVRD
jgi:cell pole-organizing protein PopZ